MCRLAKILALLVIWLPISACVSPTVRDGPPIVADPIEGAFVSYDGAKLHFIDYGGEGDVIVLLSGMSDTAHVWRDFAKRFTPTHRVLALTRRGHGASTRATSGYAIPELALDIRAFLDQQGIERAALAGHSIAGDEITAFAARYPDRVDALIYIDAALDHSDLAGAYAGDPIVPRAPTTEDFASRETLKDWYRSQFGFWSDAMEVNFEAGAVQIPDGTWRIGLPGAVAAPLNAGLSNYDLEYEDVRAPSLALYNVPRTHPSIPDDADRDLARAAQTYVDEVWRPFVEGQIERFRSEVDCNRIRRFFDSDHYLFVVEEGETAREVTTFLRNPTCRSKQ